MGLTRKKLERLIARSPDIVVGTDRKGNVAYYNDGASRVLGYEPSQVLGMYVAELYPNLDEARRVMRAMRDPGHGGVGIVETFQTTYRSKAGEDIPVAISGTILYDDQGEEDGTIGFAKDLREILRKDQLATLGEVAIGLSHEINNPLAVMLNQAELLERELEDLAGERDSSVEVERIDAIRREIGRISGILERLGEMVETEHYETVEYVGPSRMIDLGEHRPERPRDDRMKDLRILVVDDDLGICTTLKEILEAEGCVVETASDGDEGLRRIRSSNFDGYELYKEVRRLRPNLPMLMMTAFHYDKDHIIKRSRMEGLEGVIFKKPVDPLRLREAILESVGKRSEAS
jgi:PAS domain S-box-containing protein